MIRITIYAGESPRDDGDFYKPTTSSRVVEEREVTEELRKLGLEWRQADYFPDRQTLIVLEPVRDDDQVDVRSLVREAADKLERTGLL